MKALAPYVVALVAVVPLIVPDVWTGWGGLRLGVSDPVLSVIAATEQPLSIRSPGGVWAMALALLWWGLAYGHRRSSAWETGLVLIGGTAALLRSGNVWVDAAALVWPLARQFHIATPRARQFPVANPRSWVLGLIAIVSLVAVGLTAFASRPPALPAAAATASALDATLTPGAVLADWRWAADVQRQLGPSRKVLASAGLGSESPDFWLSYLQIAQGHARWAADLRELNVNLVILESTDQQRAAADLVRTSPDWHVTFDASGALVAERIRRPAVGLRVPEQ